MPAPQPPSQAVPAYPLVAAVRAALLADGTIASTVTIVRPELAEPQDTEPYITVDLVSAARDAEASYDAPGVDALIQATLVTRGTATATRSRIVPLMLAAVLDHDLAASGYTIWSVQSEGERAWSDAVANVVRRYGAVTFRVRATKP